MNQNFKINSILLGIQKGYNIPSLPNSITLFYNNILIRIFRFIGGISVLTVLFKKHLIFPEYLQNILLIIALLQISLFFIITLIRIVYGLNKLINHPNEFEVRNSPLNLLATHIGKLVYCAKVGCAVTGGSVALLTAGQTLDGVLVEAGKEPVFNPLFAKAYNKLIGASQTSLPLPTADSNAPMDEETKKIFVSGIKTYMNMTAQEKADFINSLELDKE